jgi:hypothetical protein
LERPTRRAGTGECRFRKPHTGLNPF